MIVLIGRVQKEQGSTDLAKDSSRSFVPLVFVLVALDDVISDIVGWRG